MTKWFGEPWPEDWKKNGRAPVCEDDADHIDTPIGRECGYCTILISSRSQGVVIPHLGAAPVNTPYHAWCFLEMIMGEGKVPPLIAFRE